MAQRRTARKQQVLPLAALAIHSHARPQCTASRHDPTCRGLKAEVGCRVLVVPADPPRQPKPVIVCICVHVR
jgi:hypothetical protein